MDNKEYQGNAGATLPDYVNFRNILFVQWEELHNACIDYRTSININNNVQKKIFINCYLKFFGQIRDKTKLANLNQAEKNYLHYFNNSPSKINKRVAKKIDEITRELMTNYGIFNLEGGGSDELW